MSYESWDDRRPQGRTLPLVAVALGVVAVLISSAAYLTLASDRRLLRTEVARMEARVETLATRNEQLVDRLGSAETTLERREAGIAPLAERVLKSVFTVEAERSFGTGFVAWMDEQSTYVLTAHHVVEGMFGSGVTLKRKGGGWQGELSAVDPANDLALIRMNGRPRGIQPLWQEAKTAPPRVGDQLLLIGSPFGLEGTVTSGVVSRVTKREIQTDAAANPGNSGGPALDKSGRIVGILVAGGAQNVNFAVPIARVCLKLRRCG
jgi:S1-C subfamily serine protease